MSVHTHHSSSSSTIAAVCSVRHLTTFSNSSATNTTADEFTRWQNANVKLAAQQQCVTSQWCRAQRGCASST
eukprot:19073-Heterococcus_DN1.PRE.3